VPWLLEESESPGAQLNECQEQLDARELLQRAESLAELEPLDGGDFHPYRRAWPTVRKHLPAQDVGAAGGWRDFRSLERCYRQVDEQTLLAVISEPRKLREAANLA
jgi:hypothetical protein